MDNKLIKTNKILSLIVLAISIILMGVFFGFILNSQIKNITGWFYVSIVIILLWITGITFILIKETKDDYELPSIKQGLIELGLIAYAAVLSYLLTYYMGLTGVLASSIVSLMSAMFMSKYGAVMTIGAFLGITSYNYVYLDLPLAILMVGIISYYLTPFFKGYGGKLGSIAFIGGLATLLIFNIPFVDIYKYVGIEYIYPIATAIAAALITYFINHHLKAGPIIAYSLVSIIGALFFGLFDYTTTLGLSGIVYGASFIGMSSKEKLNNYIYVIISSLIFSLVVFITPTFSNIGGRFGLTAFISVIITIVLKDKIINKIIRKKEINLQN